MTTPETTPVIIGIGEFVDRPADVSAALEPLALIAQALRNADEDAGGGLLSRLQSIEVVGFISWRYVDPVKQLCANLGIAPQRQVNASIGGETPTRLIHEAAVRIARGELELAAIVGGEALHSRKKARAAKQNLDWTPLASEAEAVKWPSTHFAMSRVAKKLGVVDPAQIYPFYETATQAAWNQSPAEAQAESAALWAQYAEVATQNPGAWLRSAPSAAEIAETGPDNRLINWPYPKLMTANPNVNQAAAIIVTSLAVARAQGIADDKLVHVWGGAQAIEPEDYLLRDRYDRSTAQNAVLQKAVELAGGKAENFGPMELYSCFPVVPKMALRALGLEGRGRSPTVAGGLTFFGGPLNNYMGHATCAMVRALRATPNEIGLLYGQGGFVNKHHALVLSGKPAPTALAGDFSVQQLADAAREPVPELIDDAAPYSGLANLEAFTVRYDRNGLAIDGIAIVRTPQGQRAMARVQAEDEATLALLQSQTKSPIGSAGYVRTDVFGKPQWSLTDFTSTKIEPRFCKVEREGHLTIVTINRPEAMNALNPQANGELAEIFDDFAADPDQWVAILTGAGSKAFCSGNDLKYMAEQMARGQMPDTPVKGYAGLTSRHDLDKPVIAAVNGVAMGGGFEIALACDLIVAAESATFALPEPKVGLAALAGGLLRLPRQLGLKHTMGLVLTGRRIAAAEARELGLVNEVVADKDLMSAARRWAEQILACSPMSIRASKQVIRKGLDTTLAEADREQARMPAVRALFRSEDVKEGPAAFAQKRAPRWKGQ